MDLEWRAVQEFLLYAWGWLELSIKFNQYSIESFQKALVRFNNFWIYLVFKDFDRCLKYLAHPSKCRAEQGAWEVSVFVVPEEIVYAFFTFLFDSF